MSKVSLVSQILEVEREIQKRRQVYPRLVAKGDMRQAEAELLIDRMKAVRETLNFLQSHEAAFREWFSKRGKEDSVDA